MEVTSLFSFVWRISRRGLKAYNGDISTPAETVCIFALIFTNDSWQADNVVTQLQGILEVAGT